LWAAAARSSNSPDENFSQKVNRKMYRAGMASIPSCRAREDRIRVVQDFTPSSRKPSCSRKGEGDGLGEVLLITKEIDRNLSFRRATC
jgi:large subunit ribosomal protein L4